MRSRAYQAAKLAGLLLICFLWLFCFTDSARADTLVLPEGLTVIDEEAFMGDTSITSVVLPDSLRVIGDRAFAGCTSLTLQVYSGSYAEAWAIENAFPYLVIND